MTNLIDYGWLITSASVWSDLGEYLQSRVNSVGSEADMVNPATLLPNEQYTLTTQFEALNFSMTGPAESCYIIFSYSDGTSDRYQVSGYVNKTYISTEGKSLTSIKCGTGIMKFYKTSVLIKKDGGTPPDPDPEPEPEPITGELTNPMVTLYAYADGTIKDLSPSEGYFKMSEGGVQVPYANVAYSVVSTVGCVVSIYAGFYRVVSMANDNASATLRGIYKGTVVDKTLTVTKIKDEEAPPSGEGNRVVVSTFIRDTEDKLGLTPEQVSQLLANANRSAAITDKFGTDINGGLVQTVMMLLREANSEANTAGISGIQGENKDAPAFWAGGDHASAIAVRTFLEKIKNEQTPTQNEYANLAKIALLHSGGAKIGDFIINELGKISMVDPSTGKERLVFSIEDLPSIEDLVAGVSSTGNITIGSGNTTTRQTLSGTANVTQADGTGSMGEVTITISGYGKKDHFGRSSFVDANLVLYRGSTKIRAVWAVSVFFLGDSYQFESATRTFNASNITLPAKGNYHFKLEVEKAGDISSASATSTSFPFSWNASLQGVNRQQYSRDGMMFFYGLTHFYFSQSRGLIVGGPTDIPGVLAKGRVSSNGARDASKYWGAKNDTSRSITKPTGTGSYRVPVSCPSGNYDVNISPRTVNRTFSVGTTTSTYFDVYFRDHNGNSADSDFSYIVVGNNY